MSTAPVLFAVGGFVLRIGQAVAVSVAGIAFAIFAMFLLVMPLMGLLWQVLPDLPSPPTDYAVAMDEEQMAGQSFTGGLISYLSMVVPVLVTICLLMRDAQWWLRGLAATLLMGFAGMGVVDLISHIVQSGASARYWPSLAIGSVGVVFLFGGFAWMQVHFARFVLWAARIKCI